MLSSAVLLRRCVARLAPRLVASPPLRFASVSSGAASSLGADGSGGTAPLPPPPPPQKPAPPSRLSLLFESAKDVLCVTLGLERVRDVGAEYDAGLRAYPWVEYVEAPVVPAPAEGEDAAAVAAAVAAAAAAPPRLLYRNVETGATTGVKPADFDARAPASARRRATDGGTRALAAAAAGAPSGWARTLAAVQEAPLIAALLSAGAAAGARVAASRAGQAAARARAAVADRLEDAREVWETSQHPLIVSASSAVDALTAETESGRAIRELTAQDGAFDAYEFTADMTQRVIPTVVPAFFRMDMPVLRTWCKDAALAQVRAVAAAREIEGLSMDGVVLNVQRVEISEAKTLERGVPIILVTSQVQYIHCVRNRKREIVEGGEGEIRAAFFVFAVTREVNPASGELVWRIVEMSMQGSMLYL